MFLIYTTQIYTLSFHLECTDVKELSRILVPVCNAPHFRRVVTLALTHRVYILLIQVLWYISAQLGAVDHHCCPLVTTSLYVPPTLPKCSPPSTHPLFSTAESHHCLLTINYPPRPPPSQATGGLILSPVRSSSWQLTADHSQITWIRLDKD